MNQVVRWQEPLPSRATRRLPRRSTNTFVGELTFGEDKGPGRRVGFESKLEYDAALMLLYHPDTVDLEEQVAPVFYTDVEGKSRPHTFDFRVTHSKGERTAVAVKPAYKAETAAFRELMGRIVVATVPRVADKMIVVTERNIDPEGHALAALFHASRHPQPELDQRIREYLTKFAGEASVRELLSDAGIGDVGFHAVVRCIRYDVLRLVSPGRVTLSSILRPGSSATCR